jgi:two-component system C4-dicarboxylate transport sensor histidine kinase DctB
MRWRPSEPAIEIAVESTQDHRVLIHVRDEGKGLDEPTLAQLFDPFFTTKSPGKGLGLGLSISYNIVEDFGGRLRAATGEDRRVGILHRAAGG